MPDNKKPEQRPSVDSLLSAPATTQEARASVPEDSRKKMKSALLVLVSVPYIAYLGWCFFLISIFPNTSDKFDVLLKPGVMSAVGGIVVLLLFALLFIKRLFRKGVDSNRRIMGSLRVLGFVAPGIIISMLVPVLTMKEPPLVVNIVDPVDQSQMVAPLSITFSVASAAEVLNKRGIGVREYSWDFDSDGEENDRTTVPEATAIFDRQGVYVVSVVMELNNGGIRAINRQIVIPQEVFSYSPMHPGVDEPIKFSVESLVDDLGLIREVQWDFDDDGIMDSVSDLPDAVHTYLRTGKVKVIAIVKLDNQTQKKYEREIEIFEPQPPPFPVEIKTEPDNLVGPAPFGTKFKVETEVPVGDVIWEFGDGTKKKRGQTVGHTFHKRGTYQVTVRVHAEDGGIAELNTAVRIVDPLVLKDLKFDGKP